MKSDTDLHILDCGVVGYRACLEQQRQLARQRRDRQIPDTVLLVEHPPVITLGARQSANLLRVDADRIKSLGIDVVDIRRGGGTTAHNPGQIVLYPILDLRQHPFGITEYIRTLEAMGIAMLAELGVAAGRRRGFPGLWVGPRKIASIGVRVSRQITYHGMAVNIKNDLRIFDFMVPCGLDGIEMTSAQKETGQDYDMDNVKQVLKRLVRHFLKPSS